MDPNATYALIQTAIANKNRDEAVQALTDLADWLRKGGFFPKTNVVRLTEQSRHLMVDRILPEHLPPARPSPEPPHRLPPIQS